MGPVVAHEVRDCVLSFGEWEEKRVHSVGGGRFVFLWGTPTEHVVCTAWHCLMIDVETALLSSQSPTLKHHLCV